MGLIVPQRSIDTLALGMSPSKVRRLYGKPDYVSHSGESETGNPIDDWVYRQRAITAEFRRVEDGKHPTLAGIFTTSPGQRTPSGVGMGSSEEQLTGAIAGLDCGRANPGERWCTLGNGALGSPQTIFVLRRGVTAEIRILLTFP